MMICTGSDQETWSYAPTLKFNNGAAKQVTTTSQVVCNEANNGYNIFSYLTNEGPQLMGGAMSGNSPCSTN